MAIQGSIYIILAWSSRNNWSKTLPLTNAIDQHSVTWFANLLANRKRRSMVGLVYSWANLSELARELCYTGSTQHLNSQRRETAHPKWNIGHKLWSEHFDTERQRKRKQLRFNSQWNHCFYTDYGQGCLYKLDLGSFSLLS